MDTTPDNVRHYYGQTLAGTADLRTTACCTPDTDLQLCRFFGPSDGYWLRAQAAYDTEVAERTLGPALRKIRPWSAQAAEQTGREDAR